VDLELPLWSTLPFVGLLLSIAVLPLASAHFWHRRYPAVSGAWALLFATPYLVAGGAQARHALAEVLLLHYLPFVVLLGALFTIAGGIVVRPQYRIIHSILPCLDILAPQQWPQQGLLQARLV
jgi:hypothetical protein